MARRKSELTLNRALTKEWKKINTERNQKLTEALRQAQAINLIENSGLHSFYRIHKNDGTYTLNKIPHHGIVQDDGVTEDALVALTYADLLSSGARGNDFEPNTSVAARIPRPELVQALNTLNFLSAKSPLYGLRGWGDHGDTKGRQLAGTATDIQMSLIDDMDQSRNPRTLAPYGKPFIQKFTDENGIEQEVLVREGLEGGHILGSAENASERHDPENIIGEAYSENHRTAPREWRQMRNGTQQREVNTDEWQLLKAAQEFQAIEGVPPARYIADMGKLAMEQPELAPRLNYLFNRMGLQFPQSL